MSMNFEYISIRSANNGWIVNVDYVDNEEFEEVDSLTCVFHNWEQVVELIAVNNMETAE